MSIHSIPACCSRKSSWASEARGRHLPANKLPGCGSSGCGRTSWLRPCWSAQCSATSERLRACHQGPLIHHGASAPSATVKTRTLDNCTACTRYSPYSDTHDTPPSQSSVGTQSLRNSILPVLPLFPFFTVTFNITTLTLCLIFPSGPKSQSRYVISMAPLLDTVLPAPLLASLCPRPFLLFSFQLHFTPLNTSLQPY